MRRFAIICLSVFLLTNCKDRSFNNDTANTLDHSRSSLSEQIKVTLNDQLRDVSDQEMHQLVMQQFGHMHLIDKNGNWRVADLAQIKTMLESNNSQKDALNLLSQVQAAMDNNPAFLDFLAQANAKSWPKIKAKIEREGKTVIPKAVAWGMALNKLMTAQLNDIKVLEACSTFWIAERQRLQLKPNDVGAFELVKLPSIEAPIKKIIGFFRTGQLDPKFAKGFLTMNISEAMAADVWMRNFDNARAGWPLAMNQAGEELDPRLQTGPTTFTADGKRLEIRLALPKKWADLYQVWNMAFVSQSSDSVLWLTKLLIPQVSDYSNYPTEYIYRRALALYATMHYMILGRLDNKLAGVPRIDWAFDAGLTDLWGNVNLKFAKSYEAEVKTKE